MSRAVSIPSPRSRVAPVQFSKLGKVMRHIAQLDQGKFAIPNNDQFNIRRRAETLLETWQGLIAASGDTTSAVNGTGMETKVSTEKQQAMAVDRVNTNEVPVNGDNTAGVVGPGHAVSTTDGQTGAPAAEEEVAMDTADD